MAKVELIMPKMGESITEATILSWNKKVGDMVELDETILEIATDKVDSEIPSPVAGKLSEILFKKDDVVEVGKVIAYILTEGEETGSKPAATPAPKEEATPSPVIQEKAPQEIPEVKEVPYVPVPATAVSNGSCGKSDRFYSPLVRNIAKQEGISISELDQIPGSGANGRVNKSDILGYVSQRSGGLVPIPLQQKNNQPQVSTSTSAPSQPKGTSDFSGGTEIIEMDRMRKMIADHMVMSKHTSPHVTSFVEADVTEIVKWRNRIKGDFQQKHGQKITFTPIFIDAVIKAIKDYPMINISVDGNNIIRKKDINIGMAAALPSGNLIVPVIKNADMLNLQGLTMKVNDLASRARTNKLKPDEIQGGTFTLTNVGTFGNVMGTPIINQPQAAILATGAIRKKPAVLETQHGDVIAIRHMMFLSLSYDHRVVDGFLGGSYLRKVADYLEAFDTNTEV